MNENKNNETINDSEDSKVSHTSAKFYINEYEFDSLFENNISGYENSFNDIMAINDNQRDEFIPEDLQGTPKTEYPIEFNLDDQELLDLYDSFKIDDQDVINALAFCEYIEIQLGRGILYGK